jgi:hypothetical protein
MLALRPRMAMIIVMPELNPIDTSILRLLEASRLAQERETTDRARAMHETSVRQDAALTIGGLLAMECESLRSAFTGRETFYVNHNKWFQRWRLREHDLYLPITAAINGRPEKFTPSQERSVRVLNIRKFKHFRASGLLATAPESTDAGPIKQDWTVSTGPRFIYTAIRTINAEREEIIESTPVHIISTDAAVATVQEYGVPLEGDDLFFPIGLIIAANDMVRSSVSHRVSKKW